MEGFIVGFGIKTRMKKTFSDYLLRKAIKEEEKKTGKYIKMNKIPTLSADQITDINSFWGYLQDDVSMNWHRILYSITGKEDKRFVPDYIFHNVIRPKMNNYTFASVWGDKCYIDYFIRDAKTVHTVVRNVNGRFLDDEWGLISIERASNIMNMYEKLVVKPSTFTNTGKGVKLLSKPYNILQLAAEYKKDFVIQIPLKQHGEIAKLNPSSVNSIRINTVLFDEEAHVMSSFIKVGETGEFADNNGKNRYFIGITADGCYENYAIDHDLKKYSEIPSGYEFAGKRVPFIGDAYKAVEKAHKNIAHFGFAFWDVCITENGEPCIIEVNLRHPDTLIGQATGRPFMGDYTEDILEYISNK